MMEPKKVDEPNSLPRWRLVLGKFAESKLPDCLDAQQRRMASALDQLYSREYAGRGARTGPKLGGTLDPTQLNIPHWLNEIRELFPQSTFETITRHALERYGMTDILKDPETLSRLEPSTELLSAVLSLKGRMPVAMMGELRRLIGRVVEEVRRRLECDIQAIVSGRKNRFRRSRLKIAQNFDPKATIRRNLKHWDPERKKLLVQEPLFNHRVRRHLPWDIILCVDQSGSMVSSVIHSAVMAGILSGLPAIRVKLVLFDTSIVDLSDRVADPVEVLMTVQLGGGTNIGAALRYCEQLVTQPRRTILVLITDFEEGADPRVLRNTVAGSTGAAYA